MAEPLWTIFGLPFTRFGVGCALALGLYALGLRLMAGKKVEPAAVRLAALLGVPLCWVMARLVFVAVDFIGAPFDGSIYINGFDSPALALRFWEGGYSLMGGLFGLLIALRIAEKATRTENAALRDAAAIALPLALCVVRLSEYGSGLGEGRRVSATWLIDSGLCLNHDGAYYWPVCLLEALAALVMLVLAIVRKSRDRLPAGDNLRITLTIFGLSQALLESLHGTDHMVVHFVRAEQVFALLIALCCMVIWSRRMRGDTGMELICWVVTLVCVGLAVLAEFGVDRWGQPVLAYLLMAAALAVIGWMANRLRAWGSVER